MNSGLRCALPGISATATAMEYAMRFESPMTKFSNVSVDAGAVGAVERYFSFAPTPATSSLRPLCASGRPASTLRRTCGIRGRSRRGLRRADGRRRFCRRRHGCRRGCLRGGRSRRRSGRFGGCDVHFDDHGERHVVQVVQRAFDELDIMTLDPCLYKVVVRGDHEEPVAHSLRMQA